MMNTTRNWCLLTLLVGIGLVMIVSVVDATPTRYMDNTYYNDGLEEQPEDILLELMARFGQTIMRARNDMENSKRTVDFGLARGFSGTQEAKHRLGLAAANYAGGPGRKRRSDDTWSNLMAAGGRA